MKNPALVKSLHRALKLEASTQVIFLLLDTVAFPAVPIKYGTRKHSKPTKIVDVAIIGQAAQDIACNNYSTSEPDTDYL